MKTLCFSLGLLLAVCCCDAIPQASEIATRPGSCCFKFSDRQLPLQLVADITKTHTSCLKQAFIIKTIKNRQICYRETFQWARDFYNNRTEGSGSY